MKIRYALDSETGLTYSMVGSEVAVPIQDRKNKFGGYDYKLLKFNLSGLGADEMGQLRWTANIPESIKQYHRNFWGAQNEVSLNEE